MQVDRRKFFASVGGAAAVAAMGHEDRAEAFEHYMTDRLDRRVGLAETAQASAELRVPRGTGNLYKPTASGFEPMPDKPTLVDFFERRFAPARHVLQSANRAVETGQPERTVFACLARRDPEPHQGRPRLLGCAALRPLRGRAGGLGDQVSPGPAVLRGRFGRLRVSRHVQPHLRAVDYEPDEYIKKDYEFARNHRYYMEARLVTVNDQYAFDENQREIGIEEFTDVIGRQFKQPKEGLGYDNSPVAHMWRSIINPDRPL